MSGRRPNPHDDPPPPPPTRNRTQLTTSSSTPPSSPPLGRVVAGRGRGNHDLRDTRARAAGGGGGGVAALQLDDELPSHISIFSPSARSSSGGGDARPETGALGFSELDALEPLRVMPGVGLSGAGIKPAGMIMSSAVSSAVEVAVRAAGVDGVDKVGRRGEEEVTTVRAPASPTATNERGDGAKSPNGGRPKTPRDRVRARQATSQTTTSQELRKRRSGSRNGTGKSKGTGVSAASRKGSGKRSEWPRQDPRESLVNTLTIDDEELAHSLVSGVRQFLREGRVRQRHVSLGMVKDRVLFLFNDIVVWTTPAPAYKIRGHVDLDGLQVFLVDESDEPEIELVSAQLADPLRFYFESEEHCRTWYEQITSTALKLMTARAQKLLRRMNGEVVSDSDEEPEPVPEPPRKAAKKEKVQQPEKQQKKQQVKSPKKSRRKLRAHEEWQRHRRPNVPTYARAEEAEIDSDSEDYDELDEEPPPPPPDQPPVEDDEVDVDEDESEDEDEDEQRLSSESMRAENARQHRQRALRRDQVRAAAHALDDELSMAMLEEDKTHRARAPTAAGDAPPMPMRVSRSAEQMADLARADSSNSLASLAGVSENGTRLKRTQSDEYRNLEAEWTELRGSAKRAQSGALDDRPRRNTDDRPQSSDLSQVDYYETPHESPVARNSLSASGSSRVGRLVSAKLALAEAADAKRKRSSRKKKRHKERKKLASWVEAPLEELQQLASQVSQAKAASNERRKDHENARKKESPARSKIPTPVLGPTYAILPPSATPGGPTPGGPTPGGPTPGGPESLGMPVMLPPGAMVQIGFEQNLKQALDEFRSLSRSDLTSLRRMRHPNIIVRKVIEAVGILLGVEAVLITRGRRAGELDWWKPAHALVSKMHFSRMLVGFSEKRAPIDDEVLDVVRDYVTNPLLTRNAVARSSAAAALLWNWVIATFEFHAGLTVAQAAQQERARDEAMGLAPPTPVKSRHPSRSPRPSPGTKSRSPSRGRRSSSKPRGQQSRSPSRSKRGHVRGNKSASGGSRSGKFKSAARRRKNSSHGSSGSMDTPPNAQRPKSSSLASHVVSPLHESYQPLPAKARRPRRGRGAGKRSHSASRIPRIGSLSRSSGKASNASSNSPAKKGKKGKQQARRGRAAQRSNSRQRRAKSSHPRAKPDKPKSKPKAKPKAKKERYRNRGARMIRSGSRGSLRAGKERTSRLADSNAAVDAVDAAIANKVRSGSDPADAMHAALQGMSQEEIDDWFTARAVRLLTQKQAEGAQ